MKKAILSILGYILTIGGFVALFAEGDPRWQILWTLGAALVVLLGCGLLKRAGVIKDTDIA